MISAEKGFTSPLAHGIEQFLAHKRILGRRFETEAYALHLFDRYLVGEHIRSIPAITPGVVDAFLASRPRHRPRSFNHLLGVLNRLFNWLVAHEVVDRSPVRSRPRRGGSQRIPFIFAPAQARRLLRHAARLPDFPGNELRGPTYRAVFAVLFGLGLRVSEVCHLCVQDVDQRRQLLIIRQTKFGKDRFVPFGPRMARLIVSYLALRRSRSDRLAMNDPLFSVQGSRPLRRQRIGSVFRGLLPDLRISVPQGASPPRVHDLRHSFAVGTLLRWYRAGVDPAQRLLHLSTFLGHVQPESTAVYLTITSDLLNAAAGRFEDFARPVLKEVDR